MYKSVGLNNMVINVVKKVSMVLSFPMNTVIGVYRMIMNGVVLLKRKIRKENVGLKNMDMNVVKLKIQK